MTATRHLRRWAGVAALAAALAAGGGLPAAASQPGYPSSGSNQQTQGYGCNGNSCKSTSFATAHVSWSTSKVWIVGGVSCQAFGTGATIHFSWCGTSGNNTGSFNFGFNETFDGQTGFYLRVDVATGGGGCDVRGRMPTTSGLKQIIVVTYCKGQALKRYAVTWVRVSGVTWAAPATQGRAGLAS